MKLSEIKFVKDHRNASAKEYRKFGFESKAKALKLYDQYDGRKWSFTESGVFHVGPLPKLLPKIDMFMRPKETITKIDCTYEKYSGKWGYYCPAQYFVMIRFRTKNEYTWMDYQRIFLVHGSTESALRRSSYYHCRQLNKTMYEERIECLKRVIVIGYIAKRRGIQYHAKNKHSARKGLERKIRKMDQNRLQNKSLTLEKGKLVRRSTLIRLFGWCKSGMDDFVAECLPQYQGVSSVRAKELKAALNKADLSYARKYYHRELIQLLGYLRNN